MDKYYKKAEMARFQTGDSFNENMNLEFEKLRVYAENKKSDWYGSGELIEQFEREMAEFFYKEDAAFFISGTMAQQCMMRVYCDNTGIYKVSYHPTCHLEIHEEGGLKKLHNINSAYLGYKSAPFTIDDLKGIGTTACVVFELPLRELGGKAPTFEELTAMVHYLRQRGIKCHLDGARILELMPYYKNRYKEVFELFDSIYVSFYKGLGGIAGSILTGSKKDINAAKLWRKRYGGTLIHMYPYVLSARQSFNENKDKMYEYWKFSLEYSDMLSRVEGAVLEPEIPVCNMFHIHFDLDVESVIRALNKVVDATEISLFSRPLVEKQDGGCFTEVVLKESYRHVPKLKLQGAVKLLNAELRKMRKNK